MDKEEAAELKRIAEEPTESELPRRADQIICDTLTTLPGYEVKDEWDRVSCLLDFMANWP